MDVTNNVISIRGSDGSIIKLEAHSVLSSTADLAREYAKAGYPDRYVVFTEKRITDEGDEEKGIYMSLLLRPSIFPSQASLLGAMSAAAMATAFEEHTTKRLGLGWVSDIYCEGSKIGSVGIEGKLDSYTTYEYIIINFGARLDDASFPPRLTDMIRKVFESENTSISMIIAKTVLNKFFGYYPHIKSSNKFMDAYTKRFILRGVRVKYVTEQKKQTCKILGVDTKTGALILEGRDGSVIHVTSPSCVLMPKKVSIPSKNQ